MKNKVRQQTVLFGNRSIAYRLHREDRKRLRIVVSPDLRVDVYTPRGVDGKRVKAAIRRKAPWITGKLNKLEEYHPLPPPKKYVSGETFVYLGRQYRLKVGNGTTQPAKLLGRFLRIGARNKRPESVKRSIHAWYRIHAEETFNRYLKKCCAVARRHGVRRPSLVIRLMRRRWGSCSSAGRITLNVNLAQAPVHCIEYVVMHELCHLKYHNHSKAFYLLLARCMPDWKTRKQALDKITLQGG